MSERRRKSIDNSEHATDEAFQTAIQKLKLWRKKDSNQGVMDQILPGLYLGGLRATTDHRLMKQNQIQAMVSVLSTEVTGSVVPSNMHLHIPLDDMPGAPLYQYFSDAIRFIHEHRMENRNVLVHCLMGVSRSVTLVVAYLITITDMPLDRAHEFVRSRRFFANPNFGFREQLKRYSKKNRDEYRKLLESKFGRNFQELHARDSVSIKTKPVNTQPQKEHGANTSDFFVGLN
ncbi:Dual specificity protein phosphatase 22 isoform X2 [Aphelenchoides bicaudatus]|nr:Dual specificity protein phosphatase 22 isoform X2 [Aphelenchoides bicaudatus]